MREDLLSKNKCRIIRNLISYTNKNGAFNVLIGYHYREA